MFCKKSILVLAICLCLIPSAVLAKAKEKADKASAQPATLSTLSAPALLDMIAMNKGKVVVINFFATWCPPCREEIPGLVALKNAYPANKVVFIGISVDEKTELVQEFVKKMGINYSVFMAGRDVPSLYKVNTIPHNVVYDRQGELAANAPGFADEADIKEFVDSLLEQKK